MLILISLFDTVCTPFSGRCNSPLPRLLERFSFIQSFTSLFQLVCVCRQMIELLIDLNTNLRRVAKLCPVRALKTPLPTLPILRFSLLFMDEPFDLTVLSLRTHPCELRQVLPFAKCVGADIMDSARLLL